MRWLILCLGMLITGVLCAQSTDLFDRNERNHLGHGWSWKLGRPSAGCGSFLVPQSMADICSQRRHRHLAYWLMVSCRGWLYIGRDWSLVDGQRAHPLGSMEHRVGGGPACCEFRIYRTCCWKLSRGSDGHRHTHGPGRIGIYIANCTASPSRH